MYNTNYSDTQVREMAGILTICGVALGGRGLSEDLRFPCESSLEVGWNYQAE